jgi:hypothetical protein
LKLKNTLKLTAGHLAKRLGKKGVAWLLVPTFASRANAFAGPAVFEFNNLSDPNVRPLGPLALGGFPWEGIRSALGRSFSFNLHGST